MTTSGTVGRTQMDVTSIIEHAARRCGVLASAIPAEVQQSARENLFLILSDFSVKGLELWCVEKDVYQMEVGQHSVTLKLGTVNVLNVLRRDGTFEDASAINPGLYLYNPSGARVVDTVVLTMPAGTYTLTLESSDDNVNWDVVSTQDVTLDALGTTVFDADTSVSKTYWRVREASGIATPTSVLFGTVTMEIPMSTMNRDDYTSLPNKGFQGRPIQYWPDRQTPQMRLWVWPVASTANTQCVVWAQRHVEDVGDLTNTLDVPQRWLNAVIGELSKFVCLELPPQMIPEGRYQLLVEAANEALATAMDAESDGTNLRIAPNIKAYTK